VCFFTRRFVASSFAFRIHTRLSRSLLPHSVFRSVRSSFCFSDYRTHTHACLALCFLTQCFVSFVRFLVRSFVYSHPLARISVSHAPMHLPPLTLSHTPPDADKPHPAMPSLSPPPNGRPLSSSPRPRAPSSTPAGGRPSRAPCSTSGTTAP
jgi:hypothetical protein